MSGVDGVGRREVRSRDEEGAPPATEHAGDARARLDAMFVGHETTTDWSSLTNFVESYRRTAEPGGQRPYHCSPQIEDGYSFDRCERLEPGPKGKPFIRGEGDYHEIDGNDIRQGRFGDCYALAALGALVRSDEGKALIKSCITEIKRDGETIYQVKLRRPLTAEEKKLPHDPKRPWKELTIEVRDEFPPARVRGGDVKDGEVEKWPMIMERALTHVLGGGDQIGHGGLPENILPYLTGEPASEISSTDLFREVVMGNPVVVDTRGKGEFTLFGLVPRHAYFVDHVFEGKDGKRYVQLSNPWGNSHPRPIPLDTLGSLCTIHSCPPVKP